MRFPVALLSVIIACGSAQAQWQIQNSHTTASLRGIHALGNGIAWASGTAGTVLRTTDDGTTWQTCTTPPEAEKLDFRGIQAFDANTAIVMSSGKGDLSRLYKTTDACKSWTLLFTNPDKDGFWDAVVFKSPDTGYILGDPVKSDDNGTMRFGFFQTLDSGATWKAFHHGEHAYQAPPDHEDGGAFAASNSSLITNIGPHETISFSFVTGGTHPSLISGSGPGPVGFICDRSRMPPPDAFYYLTLPLSLAAGKSAGGFSIDVYGNHAVVVGGDYTKPNQSQGTAAYKDPSRVDGWYPAEKLPHGYRSSVAYSPTTKT
jgi:hypothetical protein